MKVNNIIKKVAKILDLSNVHEFLNGDIESTDSISQDIEKLLLACNIVNGIIASQYMEVIEVIDKEICYGSITLTDITDKNIIEIKEITNGNGAPIEYQIISGRIYVDASFVKIKFSYFPKDVGIDDNIDYYLKMDENVFAQGVVSEYLFLKGDFEESYIYDARFKNSISSLLRPKRNIVTPAKRWL